MSSPLHTNNSQSTTDLLDSMLTQADLFAAIFQREVIRTKYGTSNQLKQASKQLRACLDRLDELTGEEAHGER